MLLDLLCHLVKTLRQLCDLILSPDGQTDPIVPVCQQSCRLFQFYQWPDRPVYSMKKKNSDKKQGSYGKKKPFQKKLIKALIDLRYILILKNAVIFSKGQHIPKE